MRIGYLKNGYLLDQHWSVVRKGEIGKEEPIRIIDDHSRLIFNNEEKRLLHIDKMKMDIYNGWGARHSTITYAFKGYLGAGETVVTNQRILHFRKIDPVMTAMDYSDPFGGLITGTGPVLKAMEAKKRGMFEFCELPLHEIAAITSFNSGSSIKYATFLKWKLHDTRIYDEGHSNPWEREIFNVVQDCLKQKEMKRFEGKHLTITYSEMAVHVKNYWKRDDLIEKAHKYINKGKFDKAIQQLNKVLEIFPNDEDTKKWIVQLSQLKPR